MNDETKNIETDLVVEDAIFAELARTRTLRAPSGETRTNRPCNNRKRRGRQPLSRRTATRPESRLAREWCQPPS